MTDLTRLLLSSVIGFLSEFSQDPLLVGRWINRLNVERSSEVLLAGK
jgi:hypothetical protein